MENVILKCCGVCKESKPLDLFNNRVRSKDGKDRLCKLCHKQNLARIATEKKNGVFQSKRGAPRLTEAEKEARKIELLEYGKQYRQEKRKEIGLQKKLRMQQSKLDGIQAYGGCCQCCGESNHKFLTLEHLNGRDKSKKRRTGIIAWNIARIEGFPDTYTVLCFNCNCAKGAYGICPHMENK